jgi:hypothetical protein
MKKEEDLFIIVNNEIFKRTTIDLNQMRKVSKSNEYEDVFLELDKIRTTFKTGTEITNVIQQKLDLPRDECIRLMTAYLLRGKNE